LLVHWKRVSQLGIVIVAVDIPIFVKQMENLTKKVIISGPDFCGVASDIQEAFMALGFKVLLINHYPHKMSERTGIKIGVSV
jgi:hypothetical protein